jgi:hypothetical protein
MFCHGFYLHFLLVVGRFFKVAEVIFVARSRAHVAAIFVVLTASSRFGNDLLDALVEETVMGTRMLFGFGANSRVKGLRKISFNGLQSGPRLLLEPTVGLEWSGL